MQNITVENGWIPQRINGTTSFPTTLHYEKTCVTNKTVSGTQEPTFHVLGEIFFRRYFLRDSQAAIEKNIKKTERWQCFPEPPRRPSYGNTESCEDRIRGRTHYWKSNLWEDKLTGIPCYGKTELQKDPVTEILSYGKPKLPSSWIIQYLKHWKDQM